MCDRRRVRGFLVKSFLKKNPLNYLPHTYIHISSIIIIIITIIITIILLLLLLLEMF